MKRTIRLTESELRGMINEAVKNTLSPKRTPKRMNEAKYNQQADAVWSKIEWIAADLNHLANGNDSSLGFYNEKTGNIEIYADKIWSMIDDLIDAKELLERMGANSPYV